MGNVTEQSISDRVLGLLRICAPTIPSDLKSTQNLLMGGWLDSLAVVELGAQIEQEFDCKISSDFFTIRSLRSIEAIAAYIGETSQGAGKLELAKTPN